MVNPQLCYKAPISSYSDNILSFIFGIFLVIIFWYSFNPRYVVIKNK